MTDTKYDYTFKIVIIGAMNVGKTSLLLRYADDIFKEHHKATIGVDFKVRSVFIDGRQVKLTIWDTAGAERYRTLLCNYYRGAHGIIIVFDVTDMESFNDLETWLNDVNRNANTDCQRVLVGNKCDLESARKVEFMTAKAFADKFKMSYIETSAKDSTGVDDTFLMMAANIMNNVNPNKMPDQRQLDSIVLGKGVPVREEGYFNCC